MKKVLKNKKGFTLIELIIVIAIIAILATIAVPKLGGFNATAKTSADNANLKMLQNIVEIYRAEKGGLPTATIASKSNFESEYGKYLADGSVPTPSSAGMYYQYDTANGKVTLGNATTPTTLVNISNVGQ